MIDGTSKTFGKTLTREKRRLRWSHKHCAGVQWLHSRKPSFAKIREVAVNLTKVWNTTLGSLQVQLPRHEYNTWVRGATLLDIDNGVAIVRAPNAFIKEGLESRYLSALREQLGSVVGFPVDVRIVLSVSGSERVEGAPINGGYAVRETRNGDNHTSPSGSYRNGVNHPLERASVQQLELHRAVRSSMLNPRYTFDRFIIGPSNRLANAACMAVAEHPAQAYNPLFLYGGVGLGKTHLLHAIGNFVLDRDPEVNVLYVSSETFTNDLINSIRRQQTEEFRIRYRNIDILLIDDIQFIAGKEQTQEEFFHTFNTLHSAGKQIIISSDRSPKAILTLEERLRSRFEWGLIVDVQMPDLETRTAILRAKAEQSPVPVPQPVIDFLAQRIQSHIRELEGCLNRVTAYAQMYNVPVTIDVATAALSELLDTNRRKRVTPDAILREVAAFYSVDLRSLQGRGRSRNIVTPRHVAMYLLREETDSSLMEIGQLLGGRDHTTVMYGCDKIAEELNTDARLRQEVATIRERLMNSAG